jgi:putative oxidoreductase
MRDFTDLLGRIFISGIFIFEAYDSLKYYQTTLEVMTEYGISWNQKLLLNTSLVFIIFGSLMVLFGYRARFGAFLLMMYWIPMTFIRHSFWNDPLPIQRDQTIQFVKNIAIAGGLLTVLLNGTGRYSIRKLFATTRV